MAHGVKASSLNCNSNFQRHALCSMRYALCILTPETIKWKDKKMIKKQIFIFLAVLLAWMTLA
ncbi:MAG: hypothetical protein R3274_11810, partial [Desulfobacterales bacterium]|nr:hypothetical protein [Desulfobacterales bacterium]